MQRSDLRLIQTQLKKNGRYDGPVDGLRGPKTAAAVRLALQNRADGLPTAWSSWPDTQQTIALVQCVCHEHGIDAGKVDGFYGPTTELAADQLRVLFSKGELPRPFADIQPIQVNPRDFPSQHEDALTAFYGPVCHVETVRVRCPWTLQLDWNPAAKTNTITIHAKLADSLGDILHAAIDHYGLEGIQQHGLDRYGGSYNCRKMRGSTNRWSMHAWAIAIDWYPSRNKLRWRSDRASLAHPDLDAWWELWEREGWLSLGRAEDRDWMHVQAAKR